MVILNRPVILITTFCSSIRQGLTHLHYTYRISSEEKYLNPVKILILKHTYASYSEPSLEAMEGMVAMEVVEAGVVEDLEVSKLCFPVCMLGY